MSWLLVFSRYQVRVLHSFFIKVSAKLQGRNW